MKIYDKEIYNKQENMKMTFIIIVVFLLGFLVGHLTSFVMSGGNADNNVKRETINEDKENHILNEVENNKIINNEN